MRVEGIKASKVNTPLTLDVKIEREVGACEIFFVSKEKSLPFRFFDSDKGVDTYTVTLEEKKRGLTEWHLEVSLGDKTLFSNSINNADFTLKEEKGAPFTLLFHLPLSVPSFLSGSVIYQIFPDRFRKGKGEIKEHGRKKAWENDLPDYQKNVGDPIENDGFFGGNLYGIIEKLDYLTTLSVGVIYLNPIFSSPSNHRYDTSDYEEIDSLLGDDFAFSTLIKEAHKRNIKIILDGVFNHTGSDSRYFNKKGRFNEVGAYESTLSPYYNWYNLYEHTEKYESWWGIDILPRLNHSYQNCRLYFARDIAKMWLERGADGWRLDVADELSDEFLEELHKNVKAFPDKAIVGEVWENAVTKIAYGKRREYFEGKQLDSVMNYPFKEAVIRLLRNGDILFFYNTLTEIYSSYPKEVSDALWNILSTHDTKRILTSLAGEEEAEKTNDELSLLRLSKEEYERGKELLKIAAVIQYTVFGSPLLYYGDEAGMEGYGDPFCRLPFPWGKEDEELLDFYRELGAFRRSHPALKDGSFKFTHIDENFLEYERVKGEDKVRVRVRITIKR